MRQLITTVLLSCFLALAGGIQAADYWTDDFVGTAGAQPTGWGDETDDANFNCEIAHSYTASYAAITRTADSTWGRVMSATHVVDASVYPMVEVTVSGISGSTGWKIGIQEDEGSYIYNDLTTSRSTTETISFNYATVMGWTAAGDHRFKVVLVVEGAGGTYIEVDSVRLYNASTPTSTVTPTVTVTATEGIGTATVSPTVSATATVTPTSTVGTGEVNYWSDHFVGTAGVQPTGWGDETDDANFNCEIAHSYTTSYAAITRTVDSTWGRVMSATHVVDASVFPMVEVTVSGISGSTGWKIGIQEDEGSYTYNDLTTSRSTTETISFNYATVMGWTAAGDHRFKVVLIVEGAGGTYIEVDSVRLYGTSSATPTLTTTVTPTNTEVSTLTFTPTVTPTFTEDPTLTNTPTITETVEFTQTVTPTVTSTFTVTLTGTETTTITPTSTMTPPFTHTTTPTITSTYTPTSTYTVTPTLTITQTETISPTVTLTPTETEVVTLTVTESPTTVVTLTMTPTHTSTATMTSETATVTPTSTEDATAEVTSTATVTSTVQILVKEKVISYPNPAKGAVTFSFEKQGAASITIDIFKMSGERVAHVQEQGSGSSAIKAAWDAVNIAPGIYLCKVVIKDNSGKVIHDEVKKIALVK